MQIHCKTLTPNPTPPTSFQSPTSSFPHTSTRFSFSTPHHPISISTIPLKSLPTLPTTTISSSTHQNASTSDRVSELTFYDLLGISSDVSLVEIKHAYKQLARTYHPDVSPPELVKEHTDRFIRVQEAYETLSDPKMRAVYDRHVARGLHLAFSARKKSGNLDLYAEDVEDKSDWRVRWQSQVSELKKRGMYKDAKQNSWGARMRRQRNGASS